MTYLKPIGPQLDVSTHECEKCGVRAGGPGLPERFESVTACPECPEGGGCVFAHKPWKVGD